MTTATGCERKTMKPGLEMRNTELVIAVLLALPLTAVAAGPAAPGAGSILQQIQPSLPQVPSSTDTGLTIHREGEGKLPQTRPFRVKKIEITGNKKIDTATLHGLVADSEGKDLTLAQLEELAARITAYYRSSGYPLARAIVPAQTIHDGVVTIEVIEADYGKVRLDNRSRVNDLLLEETLSSLQSGQAIEQKSMDRALLLLSDIPGVAVDASLRPGETVGTSDLIVIAQPAPFVSGNAALDNYGNRYTGRTRAGGTVNINDPLHHGDLLSVSGLSSGSGMNYARASYETLLDGAGTRLGGSYSALHYILGDSLANLNGHGTAQVGSLWAKHPFIRSRETNLYGQIQYDHLKLEDNLDASGIQNYRHLDDWSGTLSGDLRDGMLTGAVNTWSLAFTSGHVGFDNAAAGASDAATANTQGGFSKWNGTFSRLQGLTQKDSLYLSLSGQWTGDNLDASQQMVAGGPYTVRAYDMGVLSGDSGYLGSAEFRHDLGQYWRGQWQMVAFYDSEHVMVNRVLWVGGANSATLSGAGFGLDWAGPDAWTARAYVAKPVGPNPDLVAVTATYSARAWLQVAKAF